ncbi:helix-turn-helix domain-containing protein [Mycolicibacterium mucogenicum]|uniref:helix-turn-helix domain-containing protein n=1 Tax=Mycolicibacterium mucogenicum TaxID=56689 RepID=UPI003977ABF0
MLDAVADRGYQPVTVAHVVAKARISRRTFYELFDSKEDCFAASFEAGVELMETRLNGCVNPIWDHDDGLTGTHLAPANHALGLGGHCRVARAIGICRPDRGYRFRALGGLHRRGAQPRCREVL